MSAAVSGESEKMKKKWCKGLWTFGILILGILGGCSKAGGKTENMEAVSLTENEIEILVSAGFDRERVTDGCLTAVDKEILERRKAVLSYLEEKYSDREVELRSCTSGEYTSFFGVEESRPDTEFEVRIRKVDDQTEIEDNLYNLLVQEDYEAYIKEALEDAGEEVCKVEAELQDYFGADYTEQVSIEEAAKRHETLNGMGYLTLEENGRDVEACQDSLDKIEAALLAKGITGSYYISFGEDDAVYRKRINVY